MSEQLRVRPHARLLTMLGEQLIRNDRIALVEVIKNAYDADATSVLVDFSDFGEDFAANAESRISILDNGLGMDEETVRTHWLNPASPGKLHAKHVNSRTDRGRVMQGEKGIGRFAIFKLGRTVELVTKHASEPDEYVLTYDISMLDEEIVRAESADAPPLYIDELDVRFSRRKPRVFTGDRRPATGTRIKIGGLRGHWSEEAREAAFEDVLRLRPIRWSPEAPVQSDDFVILFLKNGKEDLSSREQPQPLARLVKQRAVLKVEGGHFDDVKREFRFRIGDVDQTISIDGSTIRGMLPFKRQFLSNPNVSEPVVSCGPFGFSFYVFDFSSKAPSQFRLERDEKKLLREHRVYLYRDGIRVYPYGDADDDWLRIDVARGTQSAGRSFSNNQLVGSIAISQESNPLLRDKTSREGLVDAGRATSDFIALIQTLLAYLRGTAYAQYVIENHASAKRQDLPEGLAKPLLALADRPGTSEELAKALRGLAEKYEREREYFVARAERTEDLAAVGLSIESASHDVIAAMGEALSSGRKLDDDLSRQSGLPGYVRSESKDLVLRLEFVSARMQDVQGLFVSTRQSQEPRLVAEYVRRVETIYGRLLGKNDIKVNLVGDVEDFVAVTTEAALLQLFVNLFDNAIYWLTAKADEDRRIEVEFDSSSKVILFSDSGPGVQDGDRPYIFEAFYSGKGESGRGLGLYIAREVGLRNGFQLDLGESKLEGATFEIDFSRSVKA